VFSTPLGEVSADQRRSAKAINFGLMYGMSAFGLARQLGIGRGDAQKYMDLYFERYPGLKRYMEETRRQARETGFVETVFGRRLYLPEIQSRNQALRQYAERSAINAPMQGTAADIIKRAMIEVDAWLQSSRMPAELIMQVHDELILEVADEAVEAIVEPLRAHMARAATLRCPQSRCRCGPNWGRSTLALGAPPQLQGRKGRPLFEGRPWAPLQAREQHAYLRDLGRIRPIFGLRPIIAAPRHV